ncbi:MAG TPA: Tn3 family transposase, partial [Alphaproteobacteria bacterium]|nr:Tn3 family transposase [Alphaproteobacteria bacterium]HQS93729.1 Tn3 family transposase [Alphaproteobacteria bacterium]
MNSVLHGSLDGLKLQTSLKNSKARHSRKYFNDGIGVSGYNEIVNSLSVAGRLIGSHEYEGHFIYEMVLHLNTSDIKPTHLSTDKHGMNALNFALFDFMEMIFAPRIPKIHRETLWGFGNPKGMAPYQTRSPSFIINRETFFVPI